MAEVISAEVCKGSKCDGGHPAGSGGLRPQRPETGHESSPKKLRSSANCARRSSGHRADALILTFIAEKVPGLPKWHQRMVPKSGLLPN